ncbi:metal dependent phosphohydrolase [Trichormus variabilis ATCC 29413]|uniref:Metal dependent phosphohydrolase n=2 Tax=Anabaena variabilis TaxID=264691 RepID=Q3MH76_TRIV2|nr:MULTISPECIES: HD family phosphohydrolase [Nostocaceae]ABA19660.1 metal dependent phosphohydrolase [Trichormus variabilis ATCC 29413]MBC1215518.1 HD family phosphohydrolase [Trichormus variabilis ARAD]MBC1254471.1 HD family phosphohydrolase [Trichormus variabilis V5]MBC1265953.1 HD family phosphohydrolase [Trichormus variabilis FSR]MBC1302227.1 HD family phosphohydrolase [Trichormus variabilis N2B]
MAKSLKKKSWVDAVNLGWVHEQRSSVVLAIAIVSLTGVIGHKLYNQPKLKIGTVAPQTIKAPRTASIEDKKRTEIERKAARKSLTPVLMVDVRTTAQIGQNLEKMLDQGNEIRISAGSFPFYDTSVLSLSSQHYLRSCSDAEWQMMLVALENTGQKRLGLFLEKPSTRSLRKQENSQNLPNTETQTSLLFPPPTVSLGQESQVQGVSLDPGQPKESISSPKTQNPEVSTNTQFVQALAELATFRMTTANQNLPRLINQITQAREAYAQASVQILHVDTITTQTIYHETVLLELSDYEWTQTQKGIRQGAERILAQGIPAGLPQSVLQNAVTLQVQAFVPKSAESLATKLLLAVLEPNLKKDEEQTREHAQKAASVVAPVMVEVKQGAVIVKKGKEITEWDFEVLEHYQLISRENNWLALLKLGGLVTGGVCIFVLVETRSKCPLRQRDRLLVLLLTLSTPGVLAMGVSYTTWGAVGLLLGSFYGRELSMTVICLLLFILPMSMEISTIGLVAGAAGGILGSYIAHRLRSREELALLGGAIAITQGGVYLLMKVLIGAAFGSSWYLILQEAGLFTLSGLAWSVVALGLSPYLEKLFDLVTPIRLAELANPNRPLLKRLATETPGTFQHTLFVATLAEAAAKHLGCNVELVRAGTLYHDIGKMHDPLGFIENQMGGPNKHETEIKDPWKSAEIIKKHVSEGLVMARRHLLPTAIQAFIPEHQGTMLIAYFHHQAEQMAQTDPNIVVNEADFRYDGPIPQSRETAIVMLADACEAALRSLKDVNTEQALTVLNNILRARWQDNQLIDSGLTREEMSQIAEIFVEVWQQFHHKRIAYPKMKSGKG